MSCQYKVFLLFGTGAIAELDICLFVYLSVMLVLCQKAKHIIRLFSLVMSPLLVFFHAEYCCDLSLDSRQPLFGVK